VNELRASNTHVKSVCSLYSHDAYIHVMLRESAHARIPIPGEVDPSDFESKLVTFLHECMHVVTA